jgi:hypothetical protein
MIVVRMSSKLKEEDLDWCRVLDWCPAEMKGVLWKSSAYHGLLKAVRWLGGKEKGKFIAYKYPNECHRPIMKQ